MPQTTTGAQQLARLLDQGRNAHGIIPHVAAGFTEAHAYSKTRAAVSDVIELSGLLVADPGATRALGVQGDTLPSLPKQIDLQASLMQRSRVAQAGARIVFQKPADRAIPIGSGDIAYVEEPRYVTLVEPAGFSIVIDGDDVPATPHSVKRSKINFTAGVGHSFSVRRELTARQFREFGSDKVAQEIWDSFVLGLPRVADHALLNQLLDGSATPLDAFSLGAAAAQGIEFAELRALVGTAGAGAAVGQDGGLRVAGVPAELTPAMPATLVGSFARAAVAIHDSLVVHVERSGRNGDVKVTLFADVQALVPSRAYFWGVA